MAGLGPAIHDFLRRRQAKSWVTGPGPVMTETKKPRPVKEFSPHAAQVDACAARPGQDEIRPICLGVA